MVYEDSFRKRLASFISITQTLLEIDAFGRQHCVAHYAKRLRFSSLSHDHHNNACIAKIEIHVRGSMLSYAPLLSLGAAMSDGVRLPSSHAASVNCANRSTAHDSRLSIASS